MTKRCSGRDFPSEVTPSTPWGGRQTGKAGRQTASPYGSPERPFHCACRLMLARWLILATSVASAFAPQKCIRLRAARFPVTKTTLCGSLLVSVMSVLSVSSVQGGTGAQPLSRAVSTARRAETNKTPAVCQAVCLAYPLSKPRLRIGYKTLHKLRDEFLLRRVRFL